MKKYTPYILILLILIGLFNPTIFVQAAPSETDVPFITDSISAEETSISTVPVITEGQISTSTTAAPSDPSRSEFQKYVDDYGCGLSDKKSLLPGCLISGSYYLFYVIPSFILYLSAYFFNVLISITLSSKLFTASAFVPAAWTVVRDLSNIFFILILLYIAIKVILGLGGSEVKKMIAKVIIIALLINFSMFFTGVIIDTSNILALIFYNKTTVSAKNTNEKEREYDSAMGENDVAGGMVVAFDPTQILTADFFKNAGTVTVEGSTLRPREMSYGILIGVTILAGSLMLFAAYALFVSGLSFLGRLIELWVLIIAAPFAFMSSTIPQLSGIERWGWEAWLKRLLTAAFMAPIFMFLLYLIFLLIKADIFKNIIAPGSMIQNILNVVLPALVIMTLLLKAKKFAVEGSGKYTEDVMKYGKMAGGLALGAAAGGTAMLGTRVIGGGGGATASWLAKKAGPGWTADRLKDISTFAQKSSFDVRGVKIAGQSLGSVTGLKVGDARKGTWGDTKKQQVEKRQKRADELEKRGTGTEKKAVDQAEIDLKEAVLQKVFAKDADGNDVELPVKLHLENMDKEIEKARIALNDIKGTGDVYGTATALLNLKAKQAKKEDLRSATIKNSDGSETSIKELEKIRNTAKVNLEVASDKITTAYAKGISGVGSKIWGSTRTAGGYSWAGADEAARKIRTGTKLDSGEKPK
ncbi:MAG: hypothetical protein ABIG99_02330 [Patescibacteria group bacterium]